MVRASAKTGEGLETIRRELVRLSPGESLHEAQLVADLLPEKGVVILVVPIDSGAPKAGSFCRKCKPSGMPLMGASYALW